MKNKPEKTSTPTGQAWRDRLNKTKSGSKPTKGTAKENATAKKTNQFTQTASGSTARKSRKGLRPG